MIFPGPLAVLLIGCVVFAYIVVRQVGRGSHFRGEGPFRAAMRTSKDSQSKGVKRKDDESA
jgi:hypothetical protein